MCILLLILLSNIRQEKLTEALLGYLPILIHLVKIKATTRNIQ